MAAMGETTSGMLGEAMGFWQRPMDLHERRKLEASLFETDSAISATNDAASGSKAYRAAELAAASLSSVPRLIGKMFKGFIVDLPLAAAEGMRSVPQLYGDKVEELEPITDWRSGGVAAGKNILASTKGAADLWLQAKKGYEADGLEGLGKNIVKGVFGTAIKTGSGKDLSASRSEL
jgi:hypothetical protein